MPLQRSSVSHFVPRTVAAPYGPSSNRPLPSPHNRRTFFLRADDDALPLPQLSLPGQRQLRDRPRHPRLRHLERARSKTPLCVFPPPAADVKRTFPFVASTVLPNGIDSFAPSVRNLPSRPLIRTRPDTTPATTLFPSTGAGPDGSVGLGVGVERRRRRRRRRFRGRLGRALAQIPIPSPSASAWSVFGTSTQLSVPSTSASPSLSGQPGPRRRNSGIRRGRRG